MSDTTVEMSVPTLLASVSNAAGSNKRAALGMVGKHGGLVTMKITNGPTGPTVQCVGRVMVAHTLGPTPATGPAGADWKTIYTFAGGTANSAVTESSYVLPPCCHFQVEFIGNTGQAVTVEAGVTVYDKLVTV